MTFSVRVRQVFLLLLTFTVFASGAAHGASPDSTRACEKVAQCAIGSSAKLRLADHSKVKGTISAVREDAVDIVPRGAKAPVTVPLAQIASASVKSGRDSLGSRLGARFQMGPCVSQPRLRLQARSSWLRPCLTTDLQRWHNCGCGREANAAISPLRASRCGRDDKGWGCQAVVNLRRAAPAAAKAPVPKSRRLPGSGTGLGVTGAVGTTVGCNRNTSGTPVNVVL